MAELIALILASFPFIFGGGGGHPHHSIQPPSQIKTHNNVPTPALLPGLIGLGAAALRKRNSALAKTED